MANLTCPFPDNINPLSPNGFMFKVDKLTDLSYFCQSAIIPDITLGSANQETPFINIPVPGEKLNYGILNVTFLVDEHMNNYLGVYNWMKALGYPEDNIQYSSFLEAQNQNLSELAKNYSDGSLSILGSNFAAVKTFRFIDLFPLSLSTLEFQNTSETVQYLQGTASFAYTYFTIE